MSTKLIQNFSITIQNETWRLFRRGKYRILNRLYYSSRKKCSDRSVRSVTSRPLENNDRPTKRQTPQPTDRLGLRKVTLPKINCILPVCVQILHGVRAIQLNICRDVILCKSTFRTNYLYLDFLGARRPLLNALSVCPSYT